MARRFTEQKSNSTEKRVSYARIPARGARSPCVRLTLSHPPTPRPPATLFSAVPRILATCQGSKRFLSCERRGHPVYIRPQREASRHQSLASAVELREKRREEETTNERSPVRRARRDEGFRLIRAHFARRAGRSPTSPRPEVFRLKCGPHSRGDAHPASGQLIFNLAR